MLKKLEQSLVPRVYPNPETPKMKICYNCGFFTKEIACGCEIHPSALPCPIKKKVVMGLDKACGQFYHYCDHDLEYCKKNRGTKNCNVWRLK